MIANITTIVLGRSVRQRTGQHHRQGLDEGANEGDGGGAFRWHEATRSYC
jgi:hypothetical protein